MTPAQATSAVNIVDRHARRSALLAGLAVFVARAVDEPYVYLLRACGAAVVCGYEDEPFDDGVAAGRTLCTFFNGEVDVPV